MDDTIFYDEQHEQSRRYAVFEDDGQVAYLYLTEPDKPVPVADCWLYNRVPPIKEEDRNSYYGKAPPVGESDAGPDAVYEGVGPPEVQLVWTEDGESVAVLVDRAPLGFITHDESKYLSFSRHLVKEGFWGKPWDEEKFRATFMRGEDHNDR